MVVNLMDKRGTWMKTILIVEDNTDVHNLLKEVLEKEKYKVLDSYSGTEALMVLEREQVDLILLDLMLPGLNGEDIIKKVKDIPIIVISAKISPEDKVKALLSGANDYLTKPFSTEELLARIQVQFRMNKDREENHKNAKLVYKQMVCNQENHTVCIEERPIYLTKTEYAIMKQLLLHPKQVVTKSKLLECISQDTLDCDENSLKVHISNIRKKIRQVTEEEYIESVWGIGFKMHE